jgi:hypothetical protein
MVTHFEMIKYSVLCKRKEGCYPLGTVLANKIPKFEGGHTPCQDFCGRLLREM